MLNALEIILFLLALVSLIILVIGLIAPKKVLRGENINRLRVVKIYLSAAIVLYVLCFILVNLDSSKHKKSTSTTPKQETVKKVSWEDKIKEVASSDKNVNEKFNEIDRYAHDYKPTSEEIKTFGNDIIKEYKDKNYIKDLSNHEYMLTNIFKSQVVERNTKEKAIKDFAFDFWQNSKYTYRGVDKTTSEATLANERQMDKALAKMNK
ncbi:hypothetical protein [Bacillus sp. BP-3]|uniref:hypothetical protein n=1 Tax=Bacillus sp. BP-3 TaxID=3022773 RepID=UPI00232E2555|nr:hypothetical protein [Bacillus sp. BP-3]MDC2863800.1 hypothetical protein [Bacillus sp. BP-3]